MDRQDEMARLIHRYALEDGVNSTEIPRLSLSRTSRPTEPLHVLYKPALCIVAQGRKQVLLGEEVYPYDRDKHLVVSVDLPVVGQVVQATLREPYLALQLDLNVALLGEMLAETGSGATNGHRPGSGLTSSSTDPALLDAAVRFLRLLDTPRDVRVLAPLVEREILYRLLTGEQAQALRQIALDEGKLGQVGRAIGWIKNHYREPFCVEKVASEAQMSSSALHHHFKAVTNMTPLQYRTRLRLQEARRLILNSSLNAATVGFSVGYGSPSQFSREYSRLFGAPPLRDTERLKASQLQEATVR